MPTLTDSSSAGDPPKTTGPPADNKSSPATRTVTVTQSSGTPSPSPSPTTGTQLPPSLRPQTPRLSRSERRLYDPTKTDVTQYNYQGGKTAVMSGGVMLGGAKHPRKDGSSKNSSSGGGGVDTKGAKTHKRGSDSGDWRKPDDAQ
ncbi:hypothetical protein AAF712_010996 [Marasmius tenuissimus]|uniref:Microtubule-associated protein Jupiter n=1 Tax=Marasmius tenuissimus TaxID=585030 RepID=A0ABR2ZMK1_9AGAR